LALQQTGLSLACGSLWRPQLNTGTLAGRRAMPNDPDPNPDAVRDEASFLTFVEALAEDRRLANLVDEGLYGAPRGWQNDSIESFLAAAVAWARDSDFGRRQGLIHASPWKALAVFLHCGKIYE
jgi:hypothetical protein